MKVNLFIDGENFINKIEDALLSQGFEKNTISSENINLKKLIRLAFPDFKIDELKFYSAKLKFHKESARKSKELILKQRILKTNLEKQGFEFILAGNVRPQTVKVDGKSKTIFKEKGVDVRIAVDLVSLSCDKNIDIAILCSSDSDLQPAVAEIRKRGIEVIYLGFENSPNKGLTYTTNRTVLFRNSEIVQVVPSSKKYSQMNINPNAIRVLCYGDSNTWGQDPKNRGRRLPVTVRWTGVLQKKLGEKYEIVEEGLSGRTTIFDRDDGEGKNGRTYLLPCMETHNPLDLVILMLGTNDFYEKLQQSPQDIANNIAVLVQMIQTYGRNSQGNSPKILLLSPIFVDEVASGSLKNFRGAEAKSKQIGGYYRKIAERFGCAFVDMAQHVQPSKHDGYHLDPDAHHTISELLKQKIKAMATK